MRISILALGSRGDIQPALALAETLASHSHHIRFITHPGFAHLAVGRNVEFLPLAAMKGEFEHLAKKKRYPLFEFRATADMAKRYGLEWSRQFRALAEGSDCLVGAGVGSFMVPTVGRHAKIPFFQAFFQPILPTRSFSSVLLPSLPFALPGFANRLSHQIVNQLVWSFFRPTASESLRELWHEPAAPLLFQIDAARDPRCPTLMAFSRHVVPRPEDWGHSIEVTGYWFLDRQTGWQPPRDLADFIAAGPPRSMLGLAAWD
jgi:sterol 3beta-glucosyltransferase